MSKAICNQYFVKDSKRNKAFACTVRCEACGGESDMSAKPIYTMQSLLDFMASSVGKHTKMGCNAVQHILDPALASTSFKSQLVP